ncbi:DivIVA domain-containing protein [Streptomyces oryzae]|uniref:DivIVA domain-containing protein n=1 Tax=Streptomyces oryzae TaxID=1434886 RepID=UPI0027DACDF0|nr:DivIVA domain-containing protein [Streptomyces oryzae]
MFVFLLISLVVVVAAVTLAVVGSAERPGSGSHGAAGGLADVPPDLLDEPLPPERPVTHADVAGLRLAVGVRGYRMEQVDDVLDRLGAELAERDARIAELESALAGAQAVAMGRATGAGGPHGTGPREDEPQDRNPHTASGPEGNAQ